MIVVRPSAIASGPFNRIMSYQTLMRRACWTSRRAVPLQQQVQIDSALLASLLFQYFCIFHRVRGTARHKRRCLRRLKRTNRAEQQTKQQSEHQRSGCYFFPVLVGINQPAPRGDASYFSKHRLLPSSSFFFRFLENRRFNNAATPK
jgi:hypothetical protein